MVCFAFIHLRLHSYCEELFWMGAVSVRRRAPSAVRTKLKFILLEEVAFVPEVYGLSLMEIICPFGGASLGEILPRLWSAQ